MIVADVAADGLLFRRAVLEAGELAPAADEDLGRVDGLALRCGQVPGVHAQADDIYPPFASCRVQAWPSPPGPESNATRPSKSKITARSSTAGPAKRPAAARMRRPTSAMTAGWSAASRPKASRAVLQPRIAVGEGGHAGRLPGPLGQGVEGQLDAAGVGVGRPLGHLDRFAEEGRDGHPARARGPPRSRARSRNSPRSARTPPAAGPARGPGRSVRCDGRSSGPPAPRRWRARPRGPPGSSP